MLKKLAEATTAAVEWAGKIMAVVAALVLSAMMLLTVADVVGRYFFNHPIKGTWELVGFLLVGAGTFGLAYCQVKKSHINITVLLDRFSPRVRGILNAAAAFIGMAGFAIISWRTFLLGKTYFLMTRGNVSDTLALPYAPFVWALSVGTGLMAVTLMVDLLRSLGEVMRK